MAKRTDDDPIEIAGMTHFRGNCHDKVKVKVVRVVQVDNRRYSKPECAIDAIAHSIEYNLWRTFRDKYFHSGENYEAMERLRAKAARRVAPIVARMFA